MSDAGSARSTALLENAFLLTGDAIVFLDRDGFFDCNPAALRMFEVEDRAEFLRKHPVDLSPEFQPDGRSSLDAVDDRIAQAYEKGHVVFEWTHKRADGSQFPVEVMLAAVDLDGRQALSATVRDLTERKRVESELARQREALHQSEKMSALGSLLAGVAHELNNPLAVVVTQAVLLRESTTDPRTITRAEKIETAADRCARIVKSFLAIARQRPPTRAPVKLDDVVDAALDLTAYGLRSSGIAVSVDLPADLPGVLGDPDQLGQLAMNLIVNAQQALQKKEAPRRLRISATAGEGRVRLAFSDNGPGVPAAIRSRIYDPFFTTKPPGGGTGIGLSLCRSVAIAHQGTLSYEDSPEGGATFVVELPAAGRAESPDEGEAAVLRTAQGGSVLIVDDEPEIVEGLREIVAPMVARVDTATTGVEALHRVDAFDYDLMISDLRMPELDGPGLHAALMGRGRGAPGRIIFVTGDALDGEVRRFLAETGMPVIEKPFTPAEVRRAVSDALASLTA